ncbi:MAG: tRNA (cytidine(56)-2'-O)-methyltransferase [Candidatus Micrarchaeota archaeon]
MNITILRLGHRKKRDKRISTHCGLVARALGAKEIIYAGEKDDSILNSINKVTKKFGGKFKTKYTASPLKEVKQFKKKGVVIHLTMYGDTLSALPKTKKPVMLIIGAEKVPRQYYEVSDYNISIGNQPHSEVAALAICVYELNGKQLEREIKGEMNIIPNPRGKTIVKRRKV